jgi:hypothetical protein
MAKVKMKLKSLLAGELVPLSEMVHDTEAKEASMDDEGIVMLKPYLDD